MNPGFVLFAKDTRRLAGFYQATLGLRVREQAATHTRLEGEGLSLVVHAIPVRIAADIQISAPPELRSQTPIKPVFVVADLAAVRAAAQAHGGGLKPDAGAWHFDGATVLDGWDPEGNVIQFRQPDGASA